MAFCGQCGLLLASGNRACPRCGTITEPELIPEAPRADDPTEISLSYPDTRSSAGPAVPPGQEKLVLRPAAENPHLKAYLQAPSDATNLMDTPSAMSPQMPQHDDIRTPYHGFAPASDRYNQAAPGQYGSWRTNVTEQPGSRRAGRGRVAALLVVLAALVVLGGIVALVMNPALLRGISGNTGATPATTPVEQARGLILRYYNDLNTHNYHDAYNLWALDPRKPPPSYESFVSGFAHTLHDDIVINAVTLFSDGKVQLDVTLTATQEVASGTKQSTYHLLYLVGQQGGAWKILNGHSV
ncbi:MAG TPA: hypothetical protein VEL69_06915 [Ktedonobacteraceae bacterium]|nr:hypothetical protein [Ktedonobacteraceae bacterium]